MLHARRARSVGDWSGVLLKTRRENLALEGLLYHVLRTIPKLSLLDPGHVLVRQSLGFCFWDILRYFKLSEVQLVIKGIRRQNSDARDPIEEHGGFPGNIVLCSSPYF